MDLYHHDEPHFTRWVIGNDYLREPFIVVDVGVQGGEHPRWQFLGDKVQVFGFDAISETIDRILVDGPKPNRSYEALALGNEDGERVFYVPQNTFSASFYPVDEFAAGARHGDGAVGARTVPIRKLDTLFAEGKIPAADYIKVDAEGFDAEVLRGASNYMAQSNVLCVTVETGLRPNRNYARGPFADINEILAPQRLVVFDLNCVRIARPAFQEQLKTKPWFKPDPMHHMPALDVGQPAYFDFVFARDFVEEQNEPELFPRLPKSVVEPTADKLIKAMINFELHGLMDCAVDIAVKFRQTLSARLDVDEAIALLIRRPPYARNSADVLNCLNMVVELRNLVNSVTATAAQASAQNEQITSAHRTDSFKTSDDSERSVRYLASALLRELGRRIKNGRLFYFR